MSTESSVSPLVRRGHTEQVLALLRQRGPTSRAAVGDHLGLSRTTLSTVVGELLHRGQVVEVAQRSATPRARGRPVTLLSLNPAAVAALGIDLRRGSVHVAAANIAHDLVGSIAKPCGAKTPWSRRLRIAVELVYELLQRQRIELTALEGIGVGVYGPVLLPGDGSVPTSMRHLSRISDTLTEEFGGAVLTDNGTRLAALAEAIWGRGVGSGNVAYVHLSRGIGGGLILDGSLFRGARGLAGEIGHVSIDPDGESCRCGGRGCLERYAGIDAVVAECQRIRPELAEIEAVLSAARDGDREVRGVLTTAGRRIGMVLAGLYNAVDLDQIVLGGELAEAGELLLAPIRDTLHRLSLRVARDGVQVSSAVFHGEAGALGGIAVVLHESTLLVRYQSPSPPPHYLRSELLTEIAGR